MASASTRASRWLISPQLTRGLAIPTKLGAVKDLPKPKAKTVLRRKRSLDINPFLANAGGMGAAENQIRKTMLDGGFKGIEGAGKPLPERNQGHFVTREEAVLDDVMKHLTKERDGMDADDKAEYKKSVVRSEVAEAKKKAEAQRK